MELLTDLLPKWLTKKSATKTELQSLIGKLAFVSKCVRPGRLFLTRILDTLRSLRRYHYWVKLSAEFRKDIRWWMRFINVYNGVSLVPTQLWSAPDSIFSTDACLTGCRGMSSEQYFHVEFPPEVLLQFTAIHLLEALDIVIAIRLWGRSWRGLRIMVHCDNFSVVSSLNSGRVQDKLLAACLREIWFLAAVHPRLSSFEFRKSWGRLTESLALELFLSERVLLYVWLTWSAAAFSFCGHVSVVGYYLMFFFCFPFTL